MEQNRIILDLCGADAGVKTLADGARQVLAKHRELSLLLVGDAAAKPYAAELADAFGARAEFLLAQDVIAQDASPERIVRGGEGSSMALALRALLQREDAIGLLSAGNTGALLVGTMFLLGLEKGLKVPALASAIPRPQGGDTVLVDCGATLCPGTREYCSFARLGAAYAKRLDRALARPRVGLLSVGTEKTKGTPAIKEAYAALEEAAQNDGYCFCGMVEGNALCTGAVDVIVCDGYAGNVLLKSHEAAGLFAMELIGQAELSPAQTVALRETLGRRFELNRRGGAAFLGTKKPVIKMHGCAEEITVLSCAEQLLRTR